jgi:hypothetical protein
VPGNASAACTAIRRRRAAQSHEGRVSRRRIAVSSAGTARIMIIHTESGIRQIAISGILSDPAGVLLAVFISS